jgi:hypothetical protein
MVMPTLPTLFAEASFDKLGNEWPSLWSILFDKTSDSIVLGLCPWFFLEKPESIFWLLVWLIDLFFWDLFFVSLLTHCNCLNLKITVNYSFEILFILTLIPSLTYHLN